MKLTLYRVIDGRVATVGTLHAGEIENPLLQELPEVWGADGKKLLSSDGASYLLAVHASLRHGTDRWTEISHLPAAPGVRSMEQP